MTCKHNTKFSLEPKGLELEFATNHTRDLSKKRLKKKTHNLGYGS